VPNLCEDGHDSPCVTGGPGGLAQADKFLAQCVPKIMAAPLRGLRAGAEAPPRRPPDHPQRARRDPV
jgi:hypothetical protein